MMAVLAEPRELRAVAEQFWFPYFTDPQTNELLVHASSLAFILQSGLSPAINEAGTPDVVRYLKRYIHECRCSFVAADKIKPPVLEPPYDWFNLFTPQLERKAYQAAGMARIWHRFKHHTKGQLVGDDVGLGKTVIAIGVLARMVREGIATKDNPIVCVVGSSHRGQWGDEIKRFCRDRMDVAVVDGTRKERVALLRPGKQVYIVSYDIVRLPQYADAMNCGPQFPSLTVFDESGVICNPESQTTLACHALAKRSKHALLFNATPIQNCLVDLWAQLKTIDNRCLGTFESFVPRYTVNYDRGKPKYVNVPEFRLRTAMLMFRRTKSECGLECAKIVSQIRSVKLSTDQAAAYTQAAGDFVRSGSSGFVAMSEMAKVQRAALVADEINPRADSAKLDDLAQLVAGELSGEKLVVFTRYRSFIPIVLRRLAALNPVCIHGKIDTRQRDANRTQFTNDPQCRAIIGTEAMSLGLNLQSAGIVVNLDLPWNPARLRQRIGRVARIGQQRKFVLCINYRAALPDPKVKTIDDYFLGVINRKKDIFDRVFGKDDIDEIKRENKIDTDAVRRFLSGLPTMGA